MGSVEAQVEELQSNRVRLRVEVPSHDVRHAVDHAASDLAATLRIPGFRKGKVPLPVLVARVGKERLFSEAVESHIGGWYRRAVIDSRLRPVSPPEYEYDLPESADVSFRFSAVVDVQPKVEVADWTALEVARAEPEVPAELVERELEALQQSVAELAPVDGRPAREGDVLVVDLESSSGERSLDTVVEVGAGRLVDEIEAALVGMAAGETKTVEYELADGSTRTLEVTVKEIKEKVPPPLDDELARSASEFDTLAELRAEIEARLREQIEAEVEAAFREAAVDALVEASGISPSGALVDARANELLTGLVRSLERRGISFETYLAVSGQAPEQVRDRLRSQAERSVARELALEAVADKLGIEVSDEELRDFVREQAQAAGEEDPDAVAVEIVEGRGAEGLREDLRLRRALDRVAAEVKPISVDLARARDKLWTPGKEKGPGDPKLWTPGSKE